MAWLIINFFQVFDSGSSCSLEDCWGCHSHPKILKKSNLKKKHLSLTAESSENEEDTDLNTMPNMNPLESACPSETEEAISDEDDDEDDEDVEDEEKMEADEDDHCQCPKSLIALPPLRLSESLSSACWKYVNFGLFTKILVFEP